MTLSNKIQVNFSGGEVSPDVEARQDLPLAQKVLARMENWISKPQGPMYTRPGMAFVRPTRNNNFAHYLSFKFSDVQSYLIEATDGYFRFFKDNAPILSSTAKTITGVTSANPAVVTSAAHGYVTGEEVYIDSVAGMTEVNGRYFYITVLTANTFSLKDHFGNAINSTSYTAYSSGGTANKVYEIKTPYEEDYLRQLMRTQNADTMYIDHRRYAPRKLTRSAHDNWTLARYSRTNDQFEADNVTFGSITGVTQANPGVVSDAAHTFENGDQVYISGIVGMTELNDRHFLIANKAAGTYELTTLAGVPVNTTSYTAWSSGGVTEIVGPTRSAAQKYPGAVAFTADARLGHHGTQASPESDWWSRSPSTAGAVRYDDFTTGTDDDHAVFFTLSPLNGEVDSILWATSTDKYIAIGTSSSVRRIYGDIESASITSTAVNAKDANSDGVLQTPPVADGSSLFYITRTSLLIEAIEYDYQIDGYAPDDKNLVSDHIVGSGLVQIVRQVSRPNIIWVLRSDGVLLGLTYKAKENISGWHRHTAGGGGVIESLGIMSRPSASDQLWCIVRREINGVTVRYHEYMTDIPMMPLKDDFYTVTDQLYGLNDEQRYLNYLWEMGKYAIQLDSSRAYDGSVYGTDAGADITMGADADIADTENVVVTATASVFTSSMVGRQIWGAYTNEGIGGGRLEITHFTSATQVEGTILDTFPATATYSAGDWFITATTVSGLEHLEGQTVGIQTDGAVPAEQTVENGSITVVNPSSIIHVGLRYVCFAKTLPLDMGGIIGPAVDKPKTIAEVNLRFRDSGGVKFGTDLYRLQQVEFRTGNTITDRAVPLYNGVKQPFLEDGWQKDKRIYMIQDLPLPTTVIAIDITCETSDGE